ncbi:MAG: hypothetical protein ABIJ46_03030 [bacterium]
MNGRGLKVLFIAGNEVDVLKQWDQSGSASRHTLAVPWRFETAEQAVALVQLLKPDVVVVSCKLPILNFCGAHMVFILRQNGYRGMVVASCSGEADLFAQAGVEVDSSVNGEPEQLKSALDGLADQRVHPSAFSLD